MKPDGGGAFVFALKPGTDEGGAFVFVLVPVTDGGGTFVFALVPGVDDRPPGMDGDGAGMEGGFGLPGGAFVFALVGGALALADDKEDFAFVVQGADATYGEGGPVRWVSE